MIRPPSTDSGIMKNMRWFVKQFLIAFDQS